MQTTRDEIFRLFEIGKITLSDVLTQLDPEQAILIGSKSSYFYIGTAANFAVAQEGFDEELRALLVSKRGKKKEELNKIMSTPPTLTTYAKTAVAGHKRVSLVDFASKVDDWMFTVNRLADEVDGFTDAINNYESLARRQVTDLHECDPCASPGYVAIVVTGDEWGKYWYAGEAKALPAFGVC